MKNKNFQKRFCINKVKKVNTKFHKIINNFFIFSIIFCSIYFIICVNDIAIKGFVIKDLKIKVAELNEKNKEIELKVYGLKSLESINSRALEMKMVKVEKIDYITVINGAVALND